MAKEKKNGNSSGGKPKTKKRGGKYDKKLAIAGTLDDVLKASVGKKK